jgi:hypothetical protein
MHRPFLAILAVSLLNGFALADPPAKAKRTPSVSRVPDLPSFAEAIVTRVDDFDRITVKIGNTDFDVALACVLPLHYWPKDEPSSQASVLEQYIIDTLRSRLVGQRRVYLALHRSTAGHPPLVQLSQLSFKMWQPDSIAGQVGWGITSFNLWIIENGFSPNVCTAASLDRSVPVISESLFERAQHVAKKRQIGIWQTKSLAGDLLTAATSQSDPQPLVFPVVDRNGLLEITRTLLDSSSKGARVATCRALQQSLPTYDAQLRNELVDELIAGYRRTSDPVFRHEISEAISTSDDTRRQTKVFLESAKSKGTHRAGSK